MVLAAAARLVEGTGVVLAQRGHVLVGHMADAGVGVIQEHLWVGLGWHKELINLQNKTQSRVLA